MFKRGKRPAAGRRWGWGKISSALLAGIGGLVFWRKRKQSKRPPD